MRLISIFLFIFNMFRLTSFKIVKHRLKRSWKVHFATIIAAGVISIIPSMIYHDVDDAKRFMKYFNGRVSTLFIHMFNIKVIFQRVIIYISEEYMNIMKYKAIIALLSKCRKLCKLMLIDEDILKAKLAAKLKILLFAYFVGRTLEFLSLERKNLITLIWAFTIEFIDGSLGAVALCMFSCFIVFFEFIVENCIVHLKKPMSEKNVFLEMYNFNTLEFEIFEFFNSTFSKVYKCLIIYTVSIMTIRVSIFD